MPKSRFITPIQKYSLNSEPLVYPLRFGPEQLNKIIKKLLQDNGINSANVNFNFSINGELVKVPISEFIESKGISEEIEEIVYDIDVQPPTFDKETKSEQIISGMRIRSNFCAVANEDLCIYDITAPQKPVVSIPTEYRMRRVEWLSLNEDKQEGVIIGAGNWAKVGVWRCNLADNSAKELIDLKGHKSTVSSLHVSRNQPLVATGCQKGELKIWSTDFDYDNLSIDNQLSPVALKKRKKDIENENVANPSPIVTVQAHSRDVCYLLWLDSPLTLPNEIVHSSSLSGNLLSGGADAFLKLWDINGADVTLVRQVNPNPYKHAYKVMDYNYTNHLILTGCQDGRLRIYDLRSEDSEVHNFRIHQTCISHTKWCPVNSNLFATSSIDGFTKLWDIRRIKDQEPVSIISSFPTAVTCLDWSPDGRWLSTSYDDGLLRFYKFE